jgi:hypothetical protein
MAGSMESGSYGDREITRCAAAGALALDHKWAGAPNRRGRLKHSRGLVPVAWHSKHTLPTIAFAGDLAGPFGMKCRPCSNVAASMPKGMLAPSVRCAAMPLAFHAGWPGESAGHQLQKR